MHDELNESPRFEEPMERRSFLGMAAWGSFFGTMFAALVGAMRLPIPAVFPERDSRFPVGKPADIPVGTLIHLQSRRVWVMRDDSGVAALSTVCPHLGCLVSREDNGDFTCPCHGSRFDEGGEVLGGPAPRGLPWHEVTMGPDGRLVVDAGREVSPETRFEV